MISGNGSSDSPAPLVRLGTKSTVSPERYALGSLLLEKCNDAVDAGLKAEDALGALTSAFVQWGFLYGVPHEIMQRALRETADVLPTAYSKMEIAITGGTAGNA